MSDEAAKDGVRRAIRALLRTDLYLLEVDATERAITHKLAEHLQREFVDWHVDCEYNRDGHDDPKRVHIPAELRRSTRRPHPDGDCVYPDIIIHRRGPGGPNYVVLEAKNSSNTEAHERDHAKLRGYRDSHQYLLRAFVVFQTREGETRGARVSFDEGPEEFFFP